MGLISLSLSLHSELLLCAIPGHQSALCHSLLNASVEPRTPITGDGKQLRMYQAFDIKVQAVLPENQGGVFAFLQWLPSDFCALFGGTVEQGVMQTSVDYILLGVYGKIPPASSALYMLTDTNDGMVIKDELLLLKHNIALPLRTPTLPGYCFSNFIAPTAVYNSVGTDAENILGDKQFLFYSLQRPTFAHGISISEAPPSPLASIPMQDKSFFASDSGISITPAVFLTSHLVSDIDCRKGTLVQVSGFLRALLCAHADYGNAVATHALSACSVPLKEEDIPLILETALHALYGISQCLATSNVEVMARHIHSRAIKLKGRIQGTQFCLFDMHETLITVWNFAMQNLLSISELCYAETLLLRCIVLNDINFAEDKLTVGARISITTDVVHARCWSIPVVYNEPPQVHYSLCCKDDPFFSFELVSTWFH